MAVVVLTVEVDVGLGNPLPRYAVDVVDEMYWVVVTLGIVDDVNRAVVAVVAAGNEKLLINRFEHLFIT